jgi:regulator of nucleoside diphosphate kinase
MPRENRIVVSRRDLARVLAILDSHSSWPLRRLHHLDLRKAIEQARVVAPEQVPADVVTLDSDVRVRNSRTGVARDYTLVCASQADVSGDQISVLGSLGAALLGRRRGDPVESPMSGGIQSLEIENVTQPQRIAVASDKPLSDAHGGIRPRVSRVLCATDLLRRSDRAIARADAIARELGAQLLLLHVVDGAASATGRPHQTMADIAIKWNADLIVLGPYRRRFGDSFRGTLAERVHSDSGPTRARGQPRLSGPVRACAPGG